MSERARALDQAREWQAIAYGDYPETWAALDYYRERGWPVDANTFPERHTVEDKVFAFKAGYRAAVDPPPSGAGPQAEELRAANVANLREMVGMAGRHRETLLAVRECILALSPGHRTGYDWNADPLFLTLKEGRALNLIDDALKSTPASPQAETSEQDVPVLRITVTRDVATEYYAAEFRSADDKVGGMGDYSATPVGALANLCATLIQIDEDNSVERRQPAPVSPVEPTPEPPTDQLRETPMGHRIFRHVCGTPEDDGECMACSQIDCPDGEPLHYHHDGCPCCSQKPTGAPAPCVWREVNPPMGPVRRMRPGCRKTAQTFTLPLVEAWKVCPYCGAPLKVERES